MSSDKIKKVYETINKHFKTINRDMVMKIVYKLDDICDMYFEDKIMNDKDRKHVNNTVLTKKILNNAREPEPNSINTILTLICAVYHFQWQYENEPNKLFNGFNTWDFIICANHKFNFEHKSIWMFNDDNIPETIEWFLNLPMDDIRKYMDME